MPATTPIPGISVYNIDTVDHYVWLVVLGFFSAFFAAFGIGANDVANAFATSVGSKALTIRQACMIAVVMEFVGATFLGGEVVRTIRKGIADETYFEDNPPLLMWGCLCVITSVGIWLVTACRLEMPVSTTHSCVGGMMGMTIALRGSRAVNWYEDPAPPDDPLPQGFSGVVLSWFLSPVLSGVLACLFFLVVRLILRSTSPFENAVKIYPFLVFICISIITLFMLEKGIKSSDEIDDMEFTTKVGVAFAIGAGVAAVVFPGYIYCRQRIEEGKFVAPPLAIEVAEQERAKNGNSSVTMTSTSSEEAKGVKAADVTVKADESATQLTMMERIKKSALSSMDTDVHAAVIVDERTFQVHQRAERFDKKAEAMFVYLQVFSACFDALAHGANDVANAVGPFATIFLLYQGNEVGSRQDMGDWRYLILGLGGVGIGVGLCLYGSQILRAIGVKLAVITPSRGFCIEMGSSTVVIMGAYYGLPLSTTHCQVGATIGVALLEGVRGFNWWVMAKTAFGWVFTCVFVGLMAGLMSAIGANAPRAEYPDIVFINASDYELLRHTDVRM